jgi:HAMP domain-containing protein
LPTPDLRLVLAKRDLSNAPQVKAARAQRVAGAQVEQVFTIADGLQGGQALAVHAAIPALGWLVFIERPVEDTFAPLRAATVRSVVVLALGLLLATLASVALARRMVAPIRRLQEGAARVGKGELDYRIDIHTGDELQALAEEFNHTTARLQDSQNTLEQKVDERTAELTESLEQQTATAEVLKVISSSPTDVQPVFDSIAKSVVRLCDADLSLVSRFDGELIELVACHGATLDGEAAVRRAFPQRTRLRDGHGTCGQELRCRTHRGCVRRPQVFDQGHGPRHGLPWRPRRSDGPEGTGHRRDFRRSAGAGDTSQDAKVDLLRTFADQAVIAFENSRLFTEVEARTEALTRSVEEMRALGEVGRAVSSTLDVETVLVAIITHAVQLSDADAGGTIYEYDETTEVFTPRASFGVSENMVESLRDSRIRLGETSLGICAVQRAPYQTPDVTLMPASNVRDLLLREGVRAVLAVPLCGKIG